MLTTVATDKETTKMMTTTAAVTATMTTSTLGGNVGNMLATCRPDSQMLALLANISLSRQHNTDLDTVFLCRGLLTFTPSS